MPNITNINLDDYIDFLGENQSDNEEDLLIVVPEENEQQLKDLSYNIYSSSYLKKEDFSSLKKNVTLLLKLSFDNEFFNDLYVSFQISCRGTFFGKSFNFNIMVIDSRFQSYFSQEKIKSIPFVSTKQKKSLLIIFIYILRIFNNLIYVEESCPDIKASQESFLKYKDLNNSFLSVFIF